MNFGIALVAGAQADALDAHFDNAEDSKHLNTSDRRATRHAATNSKVLEKSLRFFVEVRANDFKFNNNALDMLHISNDRYCS